MKKILYILLMVFGLVACNLNNEEKKPDIPEWAYGKWTCEVSDGVTYEITEDSFIMVMNIGGTNNSYVYKSGDGMTKFTQITETKFIMVAKGSMLGNAIDEEWEFSKVNDNTIHWKVNKGTTHWNGSKETDLVRITEEN